MRFLQSRETSRSQLIQVTETKPKIPATYSAVVPSLTPQFRAEGLRNTQAFLILVHEQADMEAGPISGLRLNLAGQVSGPKRSPHILDGCKLSCLWSVEQFTVHCLDDDYVPMCSYVYVIVLVTVCVYIYIYIHTYRYTHM